ncbi:MAG: hypothetical protein J5I90_02585 [Caldilineales bacterium]|nr:hypothetical protein [Caldilineales bacterium]
MNRSQLIDRKHAVIAEIRQTRSQLERERQRTPSDPGRIRSLDQRLQALMAEEYRLRLAIDRSKD